MNRRIPNLSRVFQAGAYGRPNVVGFTPASLSPALWCEIDSGVYKDAGTTLAVLDTDTCQQWNDQSGNANHIVQGTAGNRLAYATDSGNPALVSNEKFTTIPSSTYKTWFLVARITNPGGLDGLLATASDNFLLRNAADIWTGAGSYAAGGGTLRIDQTSYSSGSVSDAYHLWTLEGYAQTAAFNLFRWAAGGAVSGGAVKAVVAFSGDLSSGDRASMETYLKAKYGTP